MEIEGIEQDVLLDVTHLFKTLGDKTRLAIVILLKDKEYNVTAIADMLKMEQSAVSHQLQVLRNTRLVRFRKEGKSVYYQLNDQHIVDIIDQVLEHVQEDYNGRQ